MKRAPSAISRLTLATFTVLALSACNPSPDGAREGAKDPPADGTPPAAGTNADSTSGTNVKPQAEGTTDPMPTTPPAPTPANNNTKAGDVGETVTTSSGLKYTVLKSGPAGASPRMGDPVKVSYVGTRLDGFVFDASERHGGPASFTCGQLIEGWNEALQKMHRGDKWKLTVPAKLAYGDRGAGADIPPGATLIFEMELHDFWSFAKLDAAKTKTTASGLKYEYVHSAGGAAVGPTSAAEIRFALWNSVGKLLTSSDAQQPIRGTREGMPFPVLKEALDVLHVGDRIRFEAPPALAFGAKDSGPDLPPNSTTYWEMELVRAVQALPVPPFAMPDDSKLTKTASGLQYEVIKKGDESGKSPGVMDVVTVHYAGWLTDGTPFDSSYDRGFPMSFQLAGVVAGWTEGLQLMKPGDIYKLVVPASLGYGSRATGKIPANSTLVFQIELIKLGEQ